MPVRWEHCCDEGTVSAHCHIYLREEQTPGARSKRRRTVASKFYNTKFTIFNHELKKSQCPLADLKYQSNLGVYGIARISRNPELRGQVSNCLPYVKL